MLSKKEESMIRAMKEIGMHQSRYAWTVSGADCHVLPLSFCEELETTEFGRSLMPKGMPSGQQKQEQTLRLSFRKRMEEP